MAEDPNKAQEEAKKKQEEQRRLQEEAKTRESSARSAEQANQQATESLKGVNPKKGVEPGKKASGGNDLGKEATDANKAVGQVKGYSQTGAEAAIAENKAVADIGTKPTKLSWSTTSDPYATSIQGRSFRQTSPQEREKGIQGEAEQARDIRRMGQENLKRDSEYLRGAFGIKKDAWNPTNNTKEIIQNLEKQTGIKAGEGTQGLGNYSERDLAKYLSNPQVKTFVDNLKSGTQQIREIAPEKAPARPGEPGYQTDFQQRVAQYKETTKGQRLDTARQPTTTAQRVDPLQPVGSGVRVSAGNLSSRSGPSTRGLRQPGMYDPALGTEGSLQYAKYGNIPTNKPATSPEELKARMAKFEQAGQQNIADSAARAMRPKGAYIGGQFIANQPKNQGGMETDEQRIARREKELGIGRFASKPSYFDDKARGRRII